MEIIMLSIASETELVTFKLLEGLTEHFIVINP